MNYKPPHEIVNDLVEKRPKTDAPGGPKVNFTELKIEFEFDSAEITSEGLHQVRALATALDDKRLSGWKFQVAGHTDAKGTSVYNDALSLRRAKSVMMKLVDFGKDTASFEVVGMGERELADEDDPYGPRNRRVVVSKIE